MGLLAAAALLTAGGGAAAQTASEDAGPGGRFTLLPQEEVAVLAAQAFAVTRHPDADAEVLFQGDNIRLLPDGRISRRFQRVTHLATHRAIRAMGDPRIPFNAATQEVLIHACRTYLPDGRVVVAGERAFNQVTPRAVAMCVPDLDQQEMVVTFLGLASGCVVELDAEIRDKIAQAPWLEGMLFLQEVYPVRHRAVAISCPSHLRLHCEVINSAIDMEVLQPPGVKLYLWRVKEIPAAHERRDRAGGRRARAHLLFSSCPSWEFLAMRLREGLTQARRCDQDLLGWVERELLAGSPRTRRAVGDLILKLTAMEIRDVALEPFAHYRQPRPASETFAAGCGTVWDRAALASALLDAAGFGAGELVLRAASPRPAEAIPALVQFDRLFLSLSELGDTLLVDPAKGRRLARPADWEGHPLASLGAGGFHWIPREPVGGSAVVEVALNLAANGGLTGSAEIRLKGALFDYERAGDPESFLASCAKHFVPGALLDSAKVILLAPDACHMVFDFHTDAADDAGVSGVGRTHIRLTGGPIDIADLVGDYRETEPPRDSPAFLVGGLREQVTWRLALPPELHPVFLPPASKLQYWVAELKIETETRSRLPAQLGAPAGQVVTVSWLLDLPLAEVPPSHVAELRRVMETYRAENQRLVVLGN